MHWTHTHSYRIMASRSQEQEHQWSKNNWKEVLQVTQAPSLSPVRLEEVPCSLDWKFRDNQPPIDQSRRHHVILGQEFLPGPAGLRKFCLGKHLKNMVRVNKFLDITLKKSMEEEIPASGCKFQCSVHLGKIAWFVDKEVLQNQQQHLTLKSFSRSFQKIELPQSKSNGHIKEDFYRCVITDADKMLRKLGSVCQVPEPELERYLYLQLFNREDERIMYRVKVTEKQVTHGSTFQLSAIWSPRTLWSAKGDFICFGRAHDARITFRCATEEMPADVRRNIEAFVNSCVRNNDDGNLEMILKIDKVVVGHVFDRIVHKFSTRDGLFVVNYIKHTDHFIDKESQSEGVVTPLPPGHCCQDIEVMLKEIDYPGPEKADEIKQKVSEMVDFSLDLVDMAEGCL